MNGTVVYDARSLYHAIYGSDEQFSDNCPSFDSIPAPQGMVINQNDEISLNESVLLEKSIDEENTINAGDEKRTYELKIFPNPSSGKVFIISNEIMDIKILDLGGREIKYLISKLTDNIYEISCACENGLYQVIITEQDQTSIKKIEILR